MGEVLPGGIAPDLVGGVGAGLGWVGVGVSGSADLRVWAHEGGMTCLDCTSHARTADGAVWPSL